MEGRKLQILLFGLVSLVCIVWASPVLPSVDLYTKATDGFQCYRVPALLSTPKILFAFAEGRNGVPNPETCEFDETCPNKTIVVKKSMDFGNTWSAMQQIVTVECGTGGECGYENAVFDSITNTIFLTFCGSPGSFIVYSKDFGESWSSPTNLSAMLPSFAKNSAPGHGIQIDTALCSDQSCCPAGRLIIPYECNNGSDFACLIYSDDHGVSWQLGAVAQKESRENEVVQIVSKENTCANIYCNARDYNKTNEGKRFAATSNNAGASFDTVSLTSLIDPITSRWTGVVAGLHRLSGPSGTSRIAFSHTNNPTERINMTVHVSYDEGETWNAGKVVDAGPCGYSDLTLLSNGTAAIIYERGNTTSYDVITFALFDATWADL